MVHDFPTDENPSDKVSTDEFPEWYQEEPQDLKARAVVKFITADGSQSWEAVQFKGDDILFGQVIGIEIELWSFSDDEMQYLRSTQVVPIECQTYYEFKSVPDILDDIEKGAIS
jgi:hypothetical protein